MIDLLSIADENGIPKNCFKKAKPHLTFEYISVDENG
jgi:hypothetical protein